MMKMRKLFLKLSMLLFVLAMSVNAAWGQVIQIDMATQKIYVTSLKAQSSPASTGSGQVRLTWVDIKGNPLMNSLAEELGNVSYPSVPAEGYANEAQMIGATMFAMDGVESDAIEMGYKGSQIYPTSMTYFQADAQAADGSYFEKWAFISPAITSLGDSIMYKEGVTPTSECFKVLPDTNYNGTYGSQKLIDAVMYVSQHPNDLYAVFKKYLLSNPQATSGSLEALVGRKATLTISVEVEGDLASFDAEDMALPTFADGTNTQNQWSYDLDSMSTTVLAANKLRITLPVTFTAWEDIEAGSYSTTLTIKMAGGEGASTLNIPLTVDALDPNRPEAFLLDGKNDPNPVSGTLADILAMDISNRILRLNRPCGELEFSGKNFTLDFNGNNVGHITVASGNVTIAYNSLWGTAQSLTVEGGNVTLNGGMFETLTIENGATVTQNGAKVSGLVNNKGVLTTIDGEFNGGLTTSNEFTANGGIFKGTTAITVTGGTTVLNRGTIEGTTYGVQTKGGATTIKKLAAINGGTYSVYGNGGGLTVECGKFSAPLHGNLDFTSGYFKMNNYGVSTEGKTEMQVIYSMEANEGYAYFLGDAESAKANGVGVCRIGDVSYARLEDALDYANNNPSVANIVIFMTNDYVLPEGNYTLPANATIVVPMSDTQEKEVNAFPPRISYHDMDRSQPYGEVPQTTPSEFRRLTFANGANLEVFGDIEMSGTQFSSNEAYTSQPCGPYGRIVMEEGSHMTLQAGAEIRAWGYMTGKGEIDARRNSTVREMFQMGDWKGAMNSVKITGMGAGIVADDSDKKIFPVTQYFIQNIESPVKYHPGAVLSTSATVAEGLMGFLSVSMSATDIKVVGVSGRDQAIFLMGNESDAENTWVRKWYDAENDIQVYDVNSAAHIGSMLLDMGELSLAAMKFNVRLDSKKFDLPITNNMKIHLLSGSMDFLQNTSLLPGAEVEVDKGATVNLEMDTTEWKKKKAGLDTVYFTGALYVYDSLNWKKQVYNNKYTKVVKYSPSWNGRPTKRNEDQLPPSAKINVHGTFNTSTGFVYTSTEVSPSKKGGANIFSSNEDAGIFIFNESTSSNDTLYVHQIKNPGSNTQMGQHVVTDSVAFTIAKLKNGDGSYVTTAGTGSNHAYMYMNDEWYGDDMLFYFDCYTASVDMVKYMQEAQKKVAKELGAQSVEYDLGSAVTHMYINPQEWVEVVGKPTIQFDWSTPPDPSNDSKNPYLVGVEGNDDHTFSDAAGAGRLFILARGADGSACQWWEVEKEGNYYHCIHPDNDTYYYWDKNAGVDGTWMEKTCTITWKNWNDTVLKTANADGNFNESAYIVKYGTIAEYQGQNPTRTMNVDSTYTFIGWQPTPGRVTQDVTYTAMFESQARKYTVTFLNEGGSLIESKQWTINEVPVCENLPTKTGYHLIWSPAIDLVKGDATYTATWEEDLPEEWDVTFVNNAGSVLQPTAKVGIAAHPAYDGTTPVKENENHSEYSSNEYTYTFWGWSAVIDGVAQPFEAGAELPCPIAPTTYTAVYTQAQKTYVVRFLDEEGNLIPGQEYNLPYGAMPVCSATPTKENTAEWTYSFAWTPQIQTVMASNEPVEYRATFPATKNQYTVTLKANPSGACTFTGAGMYEYDNNGTDAKKITITVTPNENYTFNSWSDAAAIGNKVDGKYTRVLETITGDINLVANFTYTGNDKWTIKWWDENPDTNAEPLQVSTPKDGAATTFLGTIPTKAADDSCTYAFYGWSTGANGQGEVYKNGLTPKARADEDYYAYFNKTYKQFTITWKSEDGLATLETDADQKYGTATAYNHPLPTKDANANYTYAFDGWTTTVGGSTVLANGATPKVTGDATYYAHFAGTGNEYAITWVDGDGNVLQTSNVEYGQTPNYTGATPTKSPTAEYVYTFNDSWSPTVTSVTGPVTYYAQFDQSENLNKVVEPGKTVTFTEPKTLNSLVIVSNGETSSGQLVGVNYLTLTGNAYFDLALNTWSRHWHAFSVPFQVGDLRTTQLIEVKTKAGAATNRILRMGYDYDIMYYDQNERALNGKTPDCWKYVVDNGGTLTPGVAYMIAFTSHVGTIRFTALKDGDNKIQLGGDVNVTYTDPADPVDGGWNGIGNPNMYHTLMNAGVTECQVHNGDTIGSDSYITSTITNRKFVVGKAVFVQAPAPQPVVITPATTQSVITAQAPRRDRTAANSEENFIVEIAPENGNLADRIFVLTDEDKEDKYVITKDLAKAGIGTTRAQMWINRYGAKLSKNTIAPVDNQANYPMSIYAPKAGEYTLYVVAQPNADQTLYLTYDGEAIWNLSNGAYSLDLNRGTDTHYGLRISVKNAPQTATGVDEAVVNAQGETRKVLIDNKVFIIRGDKVYSIDGRLVK